MKHTVKICNGAELSFDVTIDHVLKRRDRSEILATMGSRARGYFDAAEFFVQANSAAIQNFWTEFHQKGFPSGPAFSVTITVGWLLDVPIEASLAFFVICGRTVCFYDMEGQYSIWPFITDFLAECKPGAEKTTDMNFGNVMGAILWHHRPVAAN